VSTLKEQKTSTWIDDLFAEYEQVPLGACVAEECDCPIFKGELEMCGRCGHDRSFHRVRLW
jgi:hypothetical protein